MEISIIGSFIKALRDLSRPGVLKFIALSVVLTLIGLGLALWGGMSFFSYLTGRIETGWLHWIAEILGWILALIVTVLLFVPVLGLVGALFVEPIAAVIEGEDYPNLPPVRTISVRESVLEALRFFRLVLVANLMALPLYLVPGLNLLVGLVVNGWLIAREYFALVAGRHWPTESVAMVWKIERKKLITLGLLLAACALVPMLNLFLPAIATCAMVHQAAGLSNRLQETRQA